MGAAASCLVGGPLEIVSAHFFRSASPRGLERCSSLSYDNFDYDGDLSNTVRLENGEFSRTERKLNVHIQFSATTSSEIAVVTWVAVSVKGGPYKPDQQLFIDEIPLKKSASINSSYELSSKRDAWPKGSYAVEVRLLSALRNTSRDSVGRPRLTGNVSRKKGSNRILTPGRLVLKLPYTVK